MHLSRVVPAVLLLAGTACEVDELRTGPGTIEMRVDLVAGSVVAPSDALVGGIVEYEVALRNGGDERADEGWYVRVYLSADVELGGGDILVDQFVARRALGPGAADSYARSFKVPGTVPPGEYHLIVELDATGVIDEPAEDNNASASDTLLRIQSAETDA